MAFWSSAQHKALEARSQEQVAAQGIDGRTSYFAGLLREDRPLRSIRRWTALSIGRAARLLKEYLTPRYQSYADRRREGISSDVPEVVRVLSQGYKRGLEWRGVPLGKTCFDIALYQQLIQELRPATIIEFGTGFGASTLYFADTCRALDLSTRVVTLDINGKDVDQQVLNHPDIDFIEGNAAEVARLLPEAQLATLPHPWLIVEDCHEHVSRIVQHLYPQMAAGDYLAIEDLGHVEEWSKAIDASLNAVADHQLLVDTHYTDLFGRNATCSPDSIFVKAPETASVP